MRKFLDCIKPRRRTVARPKFMFRSACVCPAADICEQLRRGLQFDVVKEKVVNGAEANHLHCRAMLVPVAA